MLLYFSVKINVCLVFLPNNLMLSFKFATTLLKSLPNYSLNTDYEK